MTVLKEIKFYSIKFTRLSGMRLLIREFQGRPVLDRSDFLVYLFKLHENVVESTDLDSFASTGDPSKD